MRRLSPDMEALRGHSIHLVETFVDPSRFEGTCYKAAGGALALDSKAAPEWGEGSNRERVLITELGADHAIPAKDNRSALLDDIRLLGWGVAAEGKLAQPKTASAVSRRPIQPASVGLPRRGP